MQAYSCLFEVQPYSREDLERLYRQNRGRLASLNARMAEQYNPELERGGIDGLLELMWNTIARRLWELEKRLGVDHCADTASLLLTIDVGEIELF